jgi:phosphatidylglycerol lysyltransferase
MSNIINFDGQIAYFKKFGEFPLSYTIAFEEDFKRLKYKDGFLSYWQGKTLNLIIGDPLTPKESYGTILDRFLEFSRDNRKKVLSVQIHEDFAKEFEKRKFYINEIGVETDIFSANFNLKGKDRTKLRRWINTAKNKNVTVKKSSFSDIPTEDLLSVSNEWIKGKQNREELNILVRKAKYSDKPLTKAYFAYIDDELKAFVVYDPMYKDNKISGYYADIIRYKKDAPNGTIDLINFNAINDFKDKGIKIFSLGFSPLADIKNLTSSNPITYMLFKLIYKFGEPLYAFKGLDFHKRAYFSNGQGIRKKVYYTSESLFDIPNLIEGFQEINILPKGSKIKAIFKMLPKIIKGYKNDKN